MVIQLQKFIETKVEDITSFIESLSKDPEITEKIKETLTNSFIEYLDKNRTTTLERDGEDFASMDLVSCCKMGPITTENYCPNCGRKIIRS